MKKIFLIISMILPLLGWSSEIVESFDLRSYNPIKNGLKEFTCEIRVEGLTDRLKKELVSLNIKNEVYYKLYWLYPGKMDLVVEGLPKGFLELKANLKSLVVNRIDYLVPQELGKRLRSYELEIKKLKVGTMVKGLDPTNNRAVNKIELFFDDDQRLSSYKSFSPLGFQESKFKYKKKSWSKNKLVLEESSAKTIQGPQVTEIDTEINYENQVGFGFPEEIQIKTTQYVVAPGKEEKKQERKGKTKITFSNYKINSGTAQEYFRK